MTTAVMLYDPAALTQAERLADQLSKTGLVPDALRGKPGDILVTFLTGLELGLSPMQSLRGLHVIKGKAIMSAQLQVALVMRSPTCKYFRPVETTDERATYETLREGYPEPTRLTFTIQQARQAGLFASNANFTKYPAAMLMARASSALARAVYPDLLLGVYEESEADEIRGTQPEPLPRTVAPVSPIRPAQAAVVDTTATPTVEPKSLPQGGQAKSPALAEPEDAPVLAAIEEAQDLRGLYGGRFKEAKATYFAAANDEQKKAINAAWQARHGTLLARFYAGVKMAASPTDLLPLEEEAKVLVKPEHADPARAAIEERRKSLVGK